MQVTYDTTTATGISTYEDLHVQLALFGREFSFILEGEHDVDDAITTGAAIALRAVELSRAEALSS